MNKQGELVERHSFLQEKTVALAAVFLISCNAMAQVSQTITREGAVISKTEPKASPLVPDAHPNAEEPLPTGATVIYSNFGTGKSLYNASEGWTEAGAEANGYPVVEAMSFTPNANYDVVRVDAAVSYAAGVNGMTMVLAENNDGIPGNVLRSASFSDLPDFGTCCTVATKRVSANVHLPVKDGQTYWLYPLPAAASSYLVWNYDTTNQSGNGAISRDGGKTWVQAPLSPFGAFDLYGLETGQ
jgi:roadblock/LC7 domain-containing protein